MLPTIHPNPSRRILPSPIELFAQAARPGSPMSLSIGLMPVILGSLKSSGDGIAAAVRRAGMGVRIELIGYEPIENELRRFRSLILAEGGHPLIYPCKWHKPSPRFYLKPSVLKRRRRWIIAVRKRGRGVYSSDWEYDWVDDLELRPRRSRGPMGRYVVT